MRFSVPRCPTCKKPAQGIIETVPVTAWLHPTGDAFEYVGESKLHWDAQVPEIDDAGHVTLICSAGHDWQAELEDEPCA